MNPTLKETLELSDNDIKEKLENEKHKLELFPENMFFMKIFSWIRKKNENLILKYPKLTIIQKKDWKI